MSSFGLDAGSDSRAMAVTAGGDARSAAATNPARLMDAQGIEMSFGVVVSGDRLQVQREKTHTGTYVGYQIGSAIQLPLGPWRDRVALGFNIHVPHKGLYEVSNASLDDIVILRRGTDARRFTLDAGLSVRIWERIAIGASLHIIPEVTADVNIDFTNDVTNSHSNVLVDYKFSPTIGIYAEAISGLHLGFSYHAAERLKLEVPAKVYISEQIGQIPVKLEGYAYTEPHTFAFGARYDFSHLSDSHLLSFALNADFEWHHYNYPLSVSAEVKLFNDAGEVLDASAQKKVSFEEAYRIRAALDWMPMDELRFSVGYAFEKTAIPAQRNVFNILDADRQVITFGGVLWSPDHLFSGFKIGFATSARFGLYDSRDMEKYIYDLSNPGFPSIRFDGWDYSWHGDILFQFK